MSDNKCAMCGIEMGNNNKYCDGCLEEMCGEDMGNDFVDGEW